MEEIDGEAAIIGDARTVLEEGVRRVADEIRTSIDFQSMREDSGRPERIVLTGPAVAIPGFCQEIGEAVGLPFDLGTVAEAKPGACAGIEPGKLAVAAGLTVEEAVA